MMSKQKHRKGVNDVTMETKDGTLVVNDVTMETKDGGRNKSVLDVIQKRVKLSR